MILSRRMLLAGVGVLGFLTAGALVIGAPPARAGTLYLSSCSRFGDNGEDTDIGGLVWQPKAAVFYLIGNRCPQRGAFEIGTTRSPGRGRTAEWVTTTPPGIQVVHVRTPAGAVTIDRYLKPDGYAASFFWKGGTQRIYAVKKCCGGLSYGRGIDRSVRPSRSFGFEVKCSYLSRCFNPPGRLLEVSGIELEAVDKTLPRLLPVGAGNLWYQSLQWVRGTWPASFQASASDGICGMEAIVNGKSLLGPIDSRPDRHSWTQCPDPQTMNLSLDTTRYPSGPFSVLLTVWG